MILSRPASYDLLPYEQRLAFMAKRAAVLMNNPDKLLNFTLKD